MKPTFFFFIFISAFFAMETASAQQINLYAGNYSAAYTGDGGAATSASLYEPSGVFADGNGNVFIVDFDNYVVRKVNASGIISTVAGSNVAGYDGDGGQATAAKIHAVGVCADAAGNMYIADAFNNVIRKVDNTGIITTIAGTGATGYTGDNGPASTARFDDPNEVRIDGAGNLYVADSHNNAIRKINTSGIITTVAGNGYNAGTGNGGYSGDGGPATAAELYYPEDVAIDKDGNIYISELYNHTVRKVDASGTITTIAGTNSAGYSGDGGPATDAKLSGAYSVAVDTSGNIYIADETNDAIRWVDASGIIHTYAGNGIAGSSGDGGPATNAELHTPTSITLDMNGNLYISDDVNNVVRVVNHVSTNVSPISSVSQKLQVSPNPNDGNFNVELLSNTTEKVNFIITDILGHTIKEIASTTNQSKPVAMNAAPGIYFISAITTEGKQTCKAIVR